LSVTELNVGSAGRVENDKDPAITENWVLSSCVAAAATAGESAKRAHAARSGACNSRSLPKYPRGVGIWRFSLFMCGHIGSHPELLDSKRHAIAA
jgi:hypothetical protein